MELNISNNEITHFGIQFLIESLALNSKTCTLSTINLSSNPLGNQGIDVISDYLENGGIITSLNVSDCKFNGPSSNKFFRAIRTGFKLQYLWANNNDFSYDKTRMSIKEAVGTNLKTISMNNCYLGYRGGVCVADGLHKNKCIINLSISSNLFNHHTGKAFGEYLSGHNSHLEVLNISNNEIGEKGSIDIFNGLSANKCLSKLMMKKNDITNLAGATLLKVMKHNKVLTNINLNENQLELSEIAAIEVFLERNKALKLKNIIPNLKTQKKSLRKYILLNKEKTKSELHRSKKDKKS